MADMQALAQAVIDGEEKVVALTKTALDEGIAAEKVLEAGLIAGMNIVGERFKAGEFYIPEVLIAARTMKMAMEILEPKLVEAGVEPVGKAVMGTVKGDLHDIGKNLVVMMLKGAGFEVTDVGTDVAAEDFAAKVKQSGARIIGLSTLLTTTMPAMKETVRALKDIGLGAKIMVGGAPVTQNFADKIGADGYAPDAASAVDLAKSLIA